MRGGKAESGCGLSGGGGGSGGDEEEACDVKAARC
ncbi:hypothetical protein L195_g039661 [Trifolium pratense]|uniref:Uncharacterized protein n=1 Tax=Trifolium pratense TaxID=57577 RepID=A0A2K3LYJ9_TRIPR|nr:hypothetical protein L195_g039661 [Trifolium pratense]